VVLEDVLVPLDVRLPGEEAAGVGDPRGWKRRVGRSTPVSRWLPGTSPVNYARGRRPSGQQGGSIAEYQTVQHRLAEIDMLIFAVALIVYGTPRRGSSGRSCGMRWPGR